MYINCKTITENNMSRVFKLFLMLAIGATLLSCKTEIESDPAAYNSNAVLTNPHYVSIEDAETELMSILSAESPQTRSGNSCTKCIASKFSTKPNVTSPATRGGTDDTTYVYVFNFADSAGYCIMSSDDRLPPLLAQVDSGNLSPTDTIDNPCMQIVVGNVVDYYKPDVVPIYDPTGMYGHRFGRMVTDSIVYYPSKDGMCEVEWNQLAPQNDSCPIVKYNDPTLGVYYDHAPAGCVPIAVAQLMSIYESPGSYQGDPFQWKEMKWGIFRAQIANLVRDLGRKENLNVSYSADGSSSYLDDVPRTFTHFGYSRGGEVKDFNYQIFDEVASGHPAIVDGSCYENELWGLIFKHSTGRHAWLAHGAMTITHKVEWLDYLTGKTGTTSINTYYYLKYNFGNGHNNKNGYKGNGFYVIGDFDTNRDNHYVTNPGENEEGNYQYRNRMVIGIRK